MINIKMITLRKYATWGASAAPNSHGLTATPVKLPFKVIFARKRHPRGTAITDVKLQHDPQC